MTPALSEMEDLVEFSVLSIDFLIYSIYSHFSFKAYSDRYCEEPDFRNQIML